MSDVMTPTQRSRCMSRIRGANTGPEVALRKALWRNGLRYRLKTSLPGRPDLVFMRERLAVFVDGCFWHGCPQHSTSPKANAAFWTNKLRRNVERDKEVTERLTSLGWVVIRFWEHEIDSGIQEVVEKIRERILEAAKKGT